MCFCGLQMNTIIARLPKDVQRLIDKMMHKCKLQMCLDQIFQFYEWNDGEQMYYLTSIRQDAFNYRKLGREYVGPRAFIWRIRTKSHNHFTVLKVRVRNFCCALLFF